MRAALGGVAPLPTYRARGRSRPRTTDDDAPTPRRLVTIHAVFSRTTIDIALAIAIARAIAGPAAQAAVRTATQIHLCEDPGDILLFLTGEEEIEDVCRKVLLNPISARFSSRDGAARHAIRLAPQ